MRGLHLLQSTEKCTAVAILSPTMHLEGAVKMLFSCAAVLSTTTARPSLVDIDNDCKAKSCGHRQRLQGQVLWSSTTTARPSGHRQRLQGQVLWTSATTARPSLVDIDNDCKAKSCGHRQRLQGQALWTSTTTVRTSLVDIESVINAGKNTNYFNLSIGQELVQFPNSAKNILSNQAEFPAFNTHPPTSEFHEDQLHLRKILLWCWWKNYIYVNTTKWLLSFKTAHEDCRIHFNIETLFAVCCTDGQIWVSAIKFLEVSFVW